MSDKNKYAYFKVRLDIMDHVKSGRLVKTPKAVFDWLCYEAANAKQPGWAALNAPIIAACIHETVSY
jgi:hypothetical protein